MSIHKSIYAINHELMILAILTESSNNISGVMHQWNFFAL